MDSYRRQLTDIPFCEFAVRLAGALLMLSMLQWGAAWGSGETPVLANVDAPSASAAIGEWSHVEDKETGEEAAASTWPRAAWLHDQLNRFTAFELTAELSNRIARALDALERVAIDDAVNQQQHIEAIGEHLLELHALLAAIPEDHLTDPNILKFYSRLSSLLFDLRRRYTAWLGAIKLQGVPTGGGDRIEPATVAELAKAAQQRLATATDDSHWQEYLELEKLVPVFSEPRFQTTHHTALARRIYGRVTSAALTQDQSAFIQHVIGLQLMNQLQAYATDDFNLRQFLIAMDEFERDPEGLHAYRWNAQYRNLRFSPQKEYQAMATLVDNVYRNANIRIAVSQQLLNQAFPLMPETREPVDDHILGARVRGTNRVRNQLAIELVPDPQRLNFLLVTRGHVSSRTQAAQSGFIFENLGFSRFRSLSHVVINQQGATVRRPEIEVNSDNRLVGIRSRFDRVPVVGWAVKQIAENQHRSNSGLAKQIVEQKLRLRAGSKIDDEVRKRLTEMESKFLQGFYYPLRARQLEPTPVQLSTTPEQAIIRYRLAGSDQLAAYSPRPAAVQHNLLNVQIHQSALNNVFEHSDINGEEFSIGELHGHLRETLRSSSSPPAATLLSEEAQPARDVRFKFAIRDGIRLEFSDNQVVITVSLAQLQLDNGQTWKDFIVAAFYRPVVSNNRIQFVLDQKRGLSLQGRKLGIGDEIALRTIFNSIFPESYTAPPVEELFPPNLDLQGLQISQLVFDNGWLGFSLSQLAGSELPGEANQPGPLRSTLRSRLFR